MLMLDAKGEDISPQLVRVFTAKIFLHFGPNHSHLPLWFEMHPDQYAEWEMCAIPVQTISGGNFTSRNRTLGGLPLELNAHLSPNVVLLRQDREIIGEIARLGWPKSMEVANAG